MTNHKAEIEKILQAEKALLWVQSIAATGYSESWRDGYEKAYEEVKNSLPDLYALIDDACLDSRVEGITDYAWMKDGVYYVGTTGRTLKEAVATLKQKKEG